MDSPGSEINESEWLREDRTPWLNEIFSLPPDRKYDPVTVRLLEAAHGAEYINNNDIAKLGTSFQDVLLAITGILLSNGMTEDEARDQIRDWEIFRGVESRDETE